MNGAWRLGLALVIAALVTAPAPAAAAPFNVVATTADLSSLAEAVGGEHVVASALVPPGTSAENYVPRPQDVERLRGAQVVVRVGLDYDLWLDRLLPLTGNRALQRGGAGYVDASNGIVLLDVKAGGLSGGEHAHGAGNPHYWLDPANAEVITGNIVEALARLDPANARYYEKRRLDFLLQVERRIRNWQTRLSPLAGRALLAYHNNWPYFARRFRLNFVGTIEPREGIPPSAASLAALLKRVQRDNVALIVRRPNEPSRDVDLIARKTGLPVAVLAGSVGDLPQAGDYLSLFETNVAALLAAMRP